MIVCSCNILSDTEVRTVANTATHRTTSYVFSCLGCRAQCGRCARTIREIMDEVFDGAKGGRADGRAVLPAPADKQL
jgi:bacterioferritin-associated ferredoxin